MYEENQLLYTPLSGGQSHLSSFQPHVDTANTITVLYEREHFPEMKKMTIAQNSKETRVGIKDGNGIDLCSVYPANNPHIYVRELQIIVHHISLDRLR